MKLLKWEMAEAISCRRWYAAAATAAREFGIALPASLVVADDVLHGRVAPVSIRIFVNGMCYMLSLPSCTSYIYPTANTNNIATINSW